MPSSTEDAQSAAGAHARRAQWGTERWLFLAGLVAFAAAVALRKLGDFDLPWHLATGRFVVALRGIPAHDPLSFTHAPLTYVETLTDVPLYWLATLGGPPALQITCGLLGGLIGFTSYWQLRRHGPIAYGAAAIVIAGMYPWMVARPATLSFVLLSLELGLIETHRRLARHGRGRRLLAAVPLGVLLWTNAHGFSTIGAVFFACYASYRVACRIARGRAGSFLPDEDGKEAGATALAGLLGLAMMPFNAAGPTLRLGPNRFAGDALSAFAFGGITECEPTTAAFFLELEPLGAVVGALALLSLAPKRAARPRDAWPNAYDVGCTLIGFIGLTWMVRTVPLAILVMMPVIVRRWSPLVPSTSIARWGMALASWLAAAYALLHVDTSLGFGFEPRHFPERAVNFIERERPRGNLWNFSPFGGYLSWRSYPHVLTFMDGRYDQAHDASLVVRSAAAMTDAREFEALLREFDFEYAVTSAKDGESFGVPLARSRRWSMVEFDDVGAVYVRNDGRNAELARRGYRVLRHLTPMPEILNWAMRGGRLAPMLQLDGHLAVAQDPSSARAAFIDACGELAVRDYPAFERATQRLLNLAPGHPALAVLAQARAQVVSNAASVERTNSDVGE